MIKGVTQTGGSRTVTRPRDIWEYLKVCLYHGKGGYRRCFSKNPEHLVLHGALGI